MAQKSHRLMFRFWLDIVKPKEEEIADKIEILKNERSFSQTIRDGIQLITNLREGKLDVLFELFPWVKAEFMEYVRELQAVTDSQTTPETIQAEPHPTSNTDRAWLEAEQERMEAERKWEQKRLADAEKALQAEREKIEAERKQSQNTIQQQLERLEQLLLQQGNQPISGIQPVASGGGGPTPINSAPKSLDVPKFSSPAYDDDDDDFELELKKDKTANMRAINNFLTSIQRIQS